MTTINITIEKIIQAIECSRADLSAKGVANVLKIDPTSENLHGIDYVAFEHVGTKLIASRINDSGPHFYRIR